MQNAQVRRKLLLAAAAVVCASSASSTRVQAQVSGLTVLSEPQFVSPGVYLVATVNDPASANWVTAPKNVNAADTTNAEVLQGTTFVLSGTGLTVGMWEPGGARIRTTHQQLVGRITTGDAGGVTTDHATHIAGTIAGSGVGNAAAKGMATNINIRSYNDVADAAELAAAIGLVAANHSYAFQRGWTTQDWGLGQERTWYGDRTLTSTEDALFGKYDSATAAIDAALHTNDRLLSVWAAGNDRDESGPGYVAFTPFDGVNDDTYVAFFSDGTDGPGGNGPGFYRVNVAQFSLPDADGNSGTGYDSLAQIQVAKNQLTVGAIDDLLAEGPGRVASMTTFSSWGPTDDGRMKPDVVGNGVNVFSASHFADSGGSGYATKTGTSSAGANVTGTMALVIQRLMQVRGTTQNPLSATSKALAIHTAYDILDVGPDYKSGYGLLDGEAAGNFINGTITPNPTNHIIEDTNNDAEQTLNFMATGGEVKATLVWNDVAGASNGAGVDDGALALVNDLDIWITDELNNVYRPFVLDPSNPNNAATTGVNFRDNVEQVLTSLLAGTFFTVHIDANGLLTGGSQNWSLLVSGALPEPATALAMLIPGAMMLRTGRRNRKK